MPRIAKVDATQAKIVAVLRKRGFRVAHTHALGMGCPDILVGGDDVNGRPALVWCEIKTLGGELTDMERDFHDLWRGLPVIVAFSEYDVLRWFGLA